VLAATMLVAASLPAWQADRGLYRPLARTCAAVAAACLAVMLAARVATDLRQLCRYTMYVEVAFQQRHEGLLEVESVQVSGG
jgi:hypothetical protein